MSAPLVALQDVFCVHRTPQGDAAALQGASLHVARGEFVCVLGPSGAGKTTLLNVIAGRQLPAAGSVFIGERDIGRVSARERASIRHTLMGVMGQRAGATLAPELAAWRAVALPLALRGAGRAQQRRRAAELLAATGLGDREHARPAEMSGGERQRVALCAALAHRPALLLADEPTAELDPQAAESVRAAIAALRQAEDLTVIMVSHDPATAALAQRVVEIGDGRIAQDARDGEQGVLVSRGGWVRLPARVLAQAGIGDRVAVHADGAQVVLTRVSAQVALPAPARNGASPSPSGVSATAPAASGTTGMSGTPLRAPGPAVHARALTVTRGRARVLTELTCTAPAGRLTVVTGVSGSGKTTLLRALGGLVSAQSGVVTLGDEELTGLDPERRAALRRRLIGYLPQEPVPVGFLSATENIVLALRLRGWSARLATARAADVLDRVGLRDRAGQRVARLSAGEAQRVALARALAPGAGVVIADEPTSRLDRARAREIAELLADAATHEHQTVICATHDEELIQRAEHTVALGATPRARACPRV